MTARQFREKRDKQNNKKRSSHQHYFFSQSSSQRTLAKFGSPISNSASNYENKQNVTKMLAMF